MVKRTCIGTQGTLHKLKCLTMYLESHLDKHKLQLVWGQVKNSFWLDWNISTWIELLNIHQRRLALIWIWMDGYVSLLGSSLLPYQMLSTFIYYVSLALSGRDISRRCNYPEKALCKRKLRNSTSLVVVARGLSSQMAAWRDQKPQFNAGIHY